MKEVIEDKPKYLILVEQDLKLNNKGVDYKFVYSSKHNFFKIINYTNNVILLDIRKKITF